MAGGRDRASVSIRWQKADNEVLPIILVTLSRSTFHNAYERSIIKHTDNTRLAYRLKREEIFGEFAIVLFPVACVALMPASRHHQYETA